MVQQVCMYQLAENILQKVKRLSRPISHMNPCTFVSATNYLNKYIMRTNPFIRASLMDLAINISGSSNNHAILGRG